MCFVPQPRAIFADRNFKNGSEVEVFCASWLENVLRATAACHFCRSQLQKWLRGWGVLCILTENVLRATGACHFCRSQLQKWLRAGGVLYILTWKNVLRATAACHFSFLCSTATSAPAALARLLFEHQEPRIIEKTQRFATFLTFRARVPSFYWLYPRVDLHSTDLTAVRPCFSTAHIVGR